MTIASGLFRETLCQINLSCQGVALLFTDVETEIRHMAARGLLSHD